MAANRLRIWEADCSLLEAVLALSFETEELLNCCQSARLEASPCGCARSVVRGVHRECHDDSPFSRLIERRLDLVHRRAIESLAAEGLEPLGDELLGRDLLELEDVAGKLWALTTCADSRAALLRAHVRAELTLAGVRSIARARAEVLP
ncbi:MAG: hypothetical protein AB7N76_10865 [Planctomycetota bacterium]